MAYVKIQIGAVSYHFDALDSIEVKALHDSGCAATIINKKIFDKIPKKDLISFSKTPNTFVVSVTGEQTPVYGQAKLYLTFQGENGIDLTFPLDVHIHDNIDHDFILGRDFTGSDAKIVETKDHIYLTHETEPTDPEDWWERAKNLSCHVPLISTKCQTYEVQSADTVLLPPFAMTSVQCKLNTAKFMPITDPDKPVLFEVNNLCQPRLKTFDAALYTYERPDDIWIPIYNDTNNEYLLTNDLRIADIHIWDENPTVYPINVVNMAELLILENNNVDIYTAEKINKDEVLTDEEKLEQFYEYLETGSYQMPMSSYIETRPTVTEMELKDIHPLTDEELQAQFKIGHLHPNHQKIALEMFQKYKAVFSRHEYDIGRAKDFEMDIEIDTTKPHIQKYVPLPQPVKIPARQILDQMLEFDLIRECNEPSYFCSNLLVTRKKDRSKIRMLLDGRIVNNATRRLPVNFTTQMEILSHLSGKTKVTTMDISQAFFQMYLAEHAQPYTAFYSEAHGRRFCFKRAPQGLKNSPLYLKLLMDKLLGNLSQYVLHYVDDILIATDGSTQQHMEIVGKVLSALEEGGLKLRPDKINLLTETVEFIGIVWKKGKLSIPEAKMQGFLKLQKPTTPTQAKALVMALSFYRKFIPKFAEISRPILELGGLHGKQFKWTRLHDLHFYKLIRAMVTHTELHLPDPNKPFYVQTDASEFCGAGRVFQKDDEGHELLLACVSRTFSKTERKYGICRKETLALLYTLKSMDFFLRYANKVILLVDAKSILFLRMCRESAGILLRFSLELSNYEAEIYHVPGTENQISDLLSRQHKSLSDLIKEHKNRHILTEQQTQAILDRLTIPEGKHFTADEVKWLLEADSLENPLIPTTRKRTASKARIGKTQVKNIPATLNQRKVKMPKETTFYRPGVILPAHRIQLATTRPDHISYTDFSSATKLILSGDLSKKSLILAQKKDGRILRILQMTPMPPVFTLIDNILYYSKNDKVRLVLPDSFLDPLINAKHYTAFGIHLSKTRIRRDLTARYFLNVKLLTTKLQFLKENCIICQFNQHTPKQHPLTKSDLIYSPRTTWACDIIPSLPKSANGHTAIFLAVDMFTGYIQLYPIRSRQTGELIEAVTRSILIPFSTPKYFRCDSETGMFSSTDFYKFMKPLGIEFLPCSTGAPWSNGAAERAVQTIKLGLKKYLQQEHTNSKWDEFLHFFCSSHNKSTSVYGYAPEQLMFGFSNPQPTDLLQFWPSQHSQDDYFNTIVETAETARANTRLEQQKRFNQNLTYRNQNLQKKSFKPGQVVLQRELQLARGPGGALQPAYQGPYVVISIDNDLSSAVIEHTETNQQVRAHFSNMTLLNYHPQHHKFPEKYDEQLLQFLPEKYSKDLYYPKSRKRNRLSLQEKDSRKLTQFQPSDDFQIVLNDEFLSNEDNDENPFQLNPENSQSDNPFIQDEISDFENDDFNFNDPIKNVLSSESQSEQDSEGEKNKQTEAQTEKDAGAQAEKEERIRFNKNENMMTQLMDTSTDHSNLQERAISQMVPNIHVSNEPNINIPKDNILSDEIINDSTQVTLQSSMPQSDVVKHKMKPLFVPQILSGKKEKEKDKLVSDKNVLGKKNIFVPNIFSSKEKRLLEKIKKKKKNIFIPQIFSKDAEKQSEQLFTEKEAENNSNKNAEKDENIQVTLRRSNRKKKPPDIYQANLLRFINKVEEIIKRKSALIF